MEMELGSQDETLSGSSGEGDYTAISRHQTQALSDVINCFTWKFHKAMAEIKPGNFAYSPLQVSGGVLGMLLGADGSTRDELASMLKTGERENELVDDFRILLHSLEMESVSTSSTTFSNDENENVSAKDVKVFYSSSQKVFHASGDSLRDKYVQDLRFKFDIDVQTVDFTSPSAALRKIRMWLESAGLAKDHGVKDALKLDALTRLVFMSTLQFCGSLSMELQYSQQDCFFHVSSNKRVPVKMLCAETEMTFAVIQKLDARAVAIPYEGNRYSLLIFLPRGRLGVGQLEYNLRGYKNAREITNEFTSTRKLYFRMPHFKIETSINMNDALKSMGASSMFDTSTADFSRLEEYPENVFISAFTQTVHFDVHEKYKSALNIQEGTFNLKTKKCEDSLEFLVEHPFFFMVIENVSKNVVVVGRVSDPSDS